MNVPLAPAFARLLLAASAEIAREAAADPAFSCPFCDKTGTAAIACCGIVSEEPSGLGSRESDSPPLLQSADGESEVELRQRARRAVGRDD
jgi:hypothetical protein